MKESITLDDIVDAVNIVKNQGYGKPLIYPVYNILTNVIIIYETKDQKPLVIGEEYAYRLEDILELDGKQIIDLTMDELREYILALKI